MGAGLPAKMEHCSNPSVATNACARPSARAALCGDRRSVRKAFYVPAPTAAAGGDHRRLLLCSVGTFAVPRPSPSISTASVNVPPTSTPRIATQPTLLRTLTGPNGTSRSCLHINAGLRHTKQMNKYERQGAILRLVQEQSLSTQGELVEALPRARYRCSTDDSLSRHPPARLVKTRGPDGRLVYALPGAADLDRLNELTTRPPTLVALRRGHRQLASSRRLPAMRRRSRTRSTTRGLPTSPAPSPARTRSSLLRAPALPATRSRRSCSTTWKETR